VISRASPGAPRYEKLPSGVEVWRVGTSIKRKLLVGRTVDRILHAKSVYKKVKELEQRQVFDVFETTEAGLEGGFLLQDASFRHRMIIQCNGTNAFGIVPGGLLSRLHKLDWAWSFRREQVCLLLVPRIIVTSEATRKVLLQQGVSTDKIRLIYQGIDLQKFHPNPVPLPTSPLKVGFVGRLEKRKGLDFIWKVAEAIGPNAGIQFFLKGNIHPSTKDEVDEKLKKFSSYVFYLGSGSHEEMAQFYQSVHVLLQPSRFENFGLVYVEGMASELVVFAGKNGGGSEIVNHGETGFLVNPDDPPTEVVGLLRDIAKNFSKYDAMRKKARSIVAQRFSLGTIADQKIAYYREASL
jgi:glycosyltransferase involved in cell wall biosynthesis